MAPFPPSDLTSAPTTKEINQALLIEALGDRLKLAEANEKCLQDVVRGKNAQVTRLEAENVRLKMQRSDTELGAQVVGLRTEVGKKDRELVELKKSLATFKENEIIILRRAAAAEQKISVMQTTMETFQKSRDAAHTKVEQHEKERLEAVRTSIEYSDRMKKAETRVAELEGKGKPVQPKQGAFKPRK
jgi:chromosome segregation ATPase